MAFPNPDKIGMTSAARKAVYIYIYIYIYIYTQYFTYIYLYLYVVVLSGNWRPLGRRHGLVHFVSSGIPCGGEVLHFML